MKRLRSIRFVLVIVSLTMVQNVVPVSAAMMFSGSVVNRPMLITPTLKSMPMNQWFSLVTRIARRLHTAPLTRPLPTDRFLIAA